VSAKGEPQGKGHEGEEQLEVMSLEREHRAHDGGKRHGSRQRAAQWLFESGPTRVQLHAA